MVLPLIPIAAGVLGGAGGFGLGSILGGWGKKESVVQAGATSIIEAAPYQTYAPAIQYAPVSTYGYQGATYIIDSPGAIAPKKQELIAKSAPEQTPLWEIPTTVQQEPTAGITEGANLPLLIGIVVVGVVAYGFVSKGGKK